MTAPGPSSVCRLSRTLLGRLPQRFWRIFVTALVAFPLSVYADQWHTSTITMIYPLSDGRFVLQFASDHPSCIATSDPDYYYVRVDHNGVTLEGLKRIYAAALAAAAQGKSVQVNFDETSAGCYINRLRASYD